jgi:hypothetical protein
MEHGASLEGQATSRSKTCCIPRNYGYSLPTESRFRPKPFRFRQAHYLRIVCDATDPKVVLGEKSGLRYCICADDLDERQGQTQAVGETAIPRANIQNLQIAIFRNLDGFF